MEQKYPYPMIERYESDAATVRNLIISPGNGTRFDLWVVDMVKAERVMVTWINFGTMIFKKGRLPHINYIMEKLKAPRSDAEEIEAILMDMGY
jgi:hypothetical protein